MSIVVVAMPALVGREPELRDLLALLDGVKQGGGALVLSGAPGVGKSALAGDSPVVLAVEDAHWLDEPSWEALAFVGRRLRSDAVFLLATLRTTATRRPGSPRRACPD